MNYIKCITDIKFFEQGILNNATCNYLCRFIINLVTTVIISECQFLIKPTDVCRLPLASLTNLATHVFLNEYSCQSLVQGQPSLHIKQIDTTISNH